MFSVCFAHPRCWLHLAVPVPTCVMQAALHMAWKPPGARGCNYSGLCLGVGILFSVGEHGMGLFHVLRLNQDGKQSSRQGSWQGRQGALRGCTAL